MATMNQGGIIKKTATEAAKVNKPKSLKDWVLGMAPEITKALPSVMSVERFSRIVLTALSSTPSLADCDRNSFLGAMMQAAALGLEVNTPENKAFLIPYRNKNKGIIECQFQIGYAGMLDLAHRAKLYVDAKTVYSNDEFSIEYGLNPQLIHKPALKNRGEIVGFYAVWKGENNSFGFEFSSKEDIEEHGKRYSQSYDKGPWKNNFEEMAKKTMVKKVLKYAPKSTEFSNALNADMATIKADTDDFTRDFDFSYGVEDIEEMEKNIVENEQSEQTEIKGD